MTAIDSLLYQYLKVCPQAEADDTASLLMEILSREQDASYIEAHGLEDMVYGIVFGRPHWGWQYGRDGKDNHKVSDECARRGLHKLRKNETLWAHVDTTFRAMDQSTFGDSLKVLDPSLV